MGQWQFQLQLPDRGAPERLEGRPAEAASTRHGRGNDQPRPGELSSDVPALRLRPRAGPRSLPPGRARAIHRHRPSPPRRPARPDGDLPRPRHSPLRRKRRVDDVRVALPAPPADPPTTGSSPRHREQPQTATEPKRHGGLRPTRLHRLAKEPRSRANRHGPRGSVGRIRAGSAPGMIRTCDLCLRRAAWGMEAGAVRWPTLGLGSRICALVALVRLEPTGPSSWRAWTFLGHSVPGSGNATPRLDHRNPVLGLGPPHQVRWQRPWAGLAFGLQVRPNRLCRIDPCRKCLQLRIFPCNGALRSAPCEGRPARAWHAQRDHAVWATSTRR